MVVRAISGAEAQVSARHVAAMLRKSRAQAIVENRDLIVHVDVDDRSIRLGEEPAEILPRNVNLRVYSARSEQQDETTAGIRFFPDGSSTGGEIILQDAKATYHVQIEWLSGQVAIVEGPAN